MKAIVAYTDAEYKIMKAKQDELSAILHGYEADNHEQIEAEYKEKRAHGIYEPWYFEKSGKRMGYAHYDFSGKVSKRLIEALGRMPDGDEIIMLIDGGFSHFGASCSVSTEGDFMGHVYTD